MGKNYVLFKDWEPQNHNLSYSTYLINLLHGCTVPPLGPPPTIYITISKCGLWCQMASYEKLDSSPKDIIFVKYYFCIKLAATHVQKFEYDLPVCYLLFAPCNRSWNQQNMIVGKWNPTLWNPESRFDLASRIQEFRICNPLFDLNGNISVLVHT